jgi:hypothetical protein
MQILYQQEQQEKFLQLRSDVLSLLQKLKDLKQKRLDSATGNPIAKDLRLE